jgi:hypothetical protein
MERKQKQTCYSGNKSSSKRLSCTWNGLKCLCTTSPCFHPITHLSYVLKERADEITSDPYKARFSSHKGVQWKGNDGVYQY